MNRLVLIGNGFDLAHGLKTKYEHFIEWYWEDWGRRLLRGQSKDESDGLCSFTLLNTLFEHKNCVSIKPYFYKINQQEINYLELAQNISRNFTDMKLMRDRVVNKVYCEPLT